MKLCCVCNNEIKIADPAILFIGENDNEKEICSECEKQIDIMINSNSINEIKSALNYLKSYALKNVDEEVSSYLKDILEANSSVIDDYETCGAKLEKKCSKCGADVPENARFCPECGSKHENKAAKIRKSSPEKSKKKWAVLIIAAALVVAACVVLGISLGSVDTAFLDEPLSPLGCNPAGGGYVEYDDWLYYSTDMEGIQGIYKMTDGTDTIKIYTGNVVSHSRINVINGWVYFLDDGIYKMRTDGGQLQKIAENIDSANYAEYILVAGDWIYYSTNHPDYPGIFRLRTNGTHHAKVLDLKSFDDEVFNIDGNWLYFMQDGIQYRMQPDGSSRSKLRDINESKMGFNLIVDGWYYYVGGDTDEFELKRRHMESGSEEIIDKGNSNHGFVIYDPFLHISDGWLYYTFWCSDPLCYKLCRIRTDGTEKTTLARASTLGLGSVAGDWIFYSDDSGSYMMRTDGSGKREFDPDKSMIN